MTELVQAIPRMAASRRMFVAGLVSATLAVAATLAIVSLTGPHGADAPKVSAYKTAAYAIAKPAGWQAVQRQGGGVVLRRMDGRGLIAVREIHPPAKQTLSQLAARLTTELKGRFTDFKPVNARVAPTRAGRAFLYTFARPKAKLVQSIMVTRVKGRTFALDALAATGQPAVARQVGAVLGTFGP